MYKLGGTASLAKKLNSDKSRGFHRDFPIEKRREEFGANYVAPPPEPSYCQLLFDGLEDTTVIMLICSAVVSLILGLGVERDFDHGKSLNLHCLSTLYIHTSKVNICFKGGSKDVLSWCLFSSFSTSRQGQTTPKLKSFAVR